MLDLRTALELDSSQPLLLYERLRRRVARGLFVDLDHIWRHHRSIIYSVARHALSINDGEFIEGLVQHLPCLARHLLKTAMDREQCDLIDRIIRTAHVPNNQAALIAQFHASELVRDFLDPTNVPRFIHALRAHQRKSLFGAHRVQHEAFWE